MQGQPTKAKDARTLEKTRYPGIYRRGTRFVVVWQHEGKQHKSFHRSLAEAREAQGIRRQPGRTRPASQRMFCDYAHDWLATYNGRTDRGLAPSTEAAYKRDIDGRIGAFFRRYKVCEVGAPEIRRFVKQLEDEGLAPSSIKKTLAPLRALFATAVEDLVVPFNPTLGVRVQRASDSTSAPSASAIPVPSFARSWPRCPRGRGDCAHCWRQPDCASGRPSGSTGTT